ncbi:hypothetical protein UCRPC4_g01101 [Phaeomoniella chlamydospora]|uniref:J domain-containing protein n=1 Tax=Phaeomoniella chlamydospora TaxID=158046 RepID=A0A0G2EZL8_PHACM|nr:hypothetical protein UCRPC4_g01101 [Phaeomoniella chlamydospora]
MAKDEEAEALDLLDKEAKEYDKDAEIDRILSAFRLDSYAVLDLQPGVPDSDIKVQYRKKSLLIHPDKTKNPLAPEAFDRLKKAHTALLEEKTRTHLDECIADARTLLIREKKLSKDDTEVLQSEEFRVEWRKKTIEVLVEAEARKRRQLKAQMQEEGRAQKKEDDELQERKRKRDEQQRWEDTREERIGNWRDFQAKKKTGGSGSGGGALGGLGGPEKKKKKMKVLG